MVGGVVPDGGPGAATTNGVAIHHIKPALTAHAGQRICWQQESLLLLQGFPQINSRPLLCPIPVVHLEPDP